MEHKLLRIAAVLERTALSRASVYKFMNDGSFPRPVAIGARAVAWVEADIDDWIQAAIDRRDQ